MGPRDDEVIEWVSRAPLFDWWIYFGLLIVLVGPLFAGRAIGGIDSAIADFLLPVFVLLSAAPQAKAIRHHLIVGRHILPEYK